MASTLTTWDAFLKEWYTKDRIESHTYSERPLLAKIPKDESGSGDLCVDPVIWANPQGLGATLAKAQAGAAQASGGNVRGSKWTSTWGAYSAAVEVGDQVIKASRDNVGAFLRNQKEEIDRLYDAWGDTFAAYLYADSGRALASGTISSGVVTVANLATLVNIEVGQILVASADDGTTGTLLGSGSVGYVVAVNRNAGTFTVATSSGGSAATPSGWTGTMYFFRDGDWGQSGNTIFDGLGAWIPGSDPSATTFHGVVRTLDIQRLSGTRLTSAEISGLGIEARLKRLVTRMSGVGGGKKGPSDIMLNPEQWQTLADSLDAKGYREIGADAKFGFSGISVSWAGKSVSVWSDPFAPPTTAFAVRMEVLKFRSMLGCPHVLDGDGLTMLRKTSSNDYEHRLQAYPAFHVVAPGWCGRVPLL